MGRGKKGRWSFRWGWFPDEKFPQAKIKASKAQSRIMKTNPATSEGIGVFFELGSCPNNVRHLRSPERLQGQPANPAARGHVPDDRPLGLTTRRHVERRRPSPLSITTSRADTSRWPTRLSTGRPQREVILSGARREPRPAGTSSKRKRTPKPGLTKNGRSRSSGGMFFTRFGGLGAEKLLTSGQTGVKPLYYTC